MTLLKDLEELNPKAYNEILEIILDEAGLKKLSAIEKNPDQETKAQSQDPEPIRRSMANRIIREPEISLLFSSKINEYEKFQSQNSAPSFSLGNLFRSDVSFGNESRQDNFINFLKKIPNGEKIPDHIQKYFGEIGTAIIENPDHLKTLGKATDCAKWGAIYAQMGLGGMAGAQFAKALETVNKIPEIKDALLATADLIKPDIKESEKALERKDEASSKDAVASKPEAESKSELKSTQDSKSEINPEKTPSRGWRALLNLKNEGKKEGLSFVEKLKNTMEKNKSPGRE